MNLNELRDLVVKDLVEYHGVPEELAAKFCNYEHPEAARRVYWGFLIGCKHDKEKSV